MVRSRPSRVAHRRRDTRAMPAGTDAGYASRRPTTRRPVAASPATEQLSFEDQPPDSEQRQVRGAGSRRAAINGR